MPRRAAQPKRILFLASQFPHPANSGATIKTASILDHLRQKHDVNLLCLRAEELNADQLEWAEQFAGFESVHMRRGRSPLNLARSYASRVPLSITRNRSSRMTSLVERACRETEFDAVFVDGWLMAQYLPEGFEGKKLLHEHNAEYVMWDRQAAIVRGPALRRLVRAEARRVRAYEAAIMGRFDVVFAGRFTDVLLSDGDPRAVTVGRVSSGFFSVFDGTAAVGPVAPRRPMLHAWRLGFVHPVSGERVSVESPVPPDLARGLARLRQYRS